MGRTTNVVCPVPFEATIWTAQVANLAVPRFPRRASVRKGQLIMGAIYAASGLFHFLFTPAYSRIVPSYLPAHRTLVLISGVAEFAGGIGLLVPETRTGQPRRTAAWMLVLLLFAVFPANVAMVAEHERFPDVPLWAAWVRLPLQAPLVWWAWLYTKRRRREVAIG